MISWKYTFKRLNEEYEIANKKKQALDKLFESGRISQGTRDSFNGEINAAIADIEKQQKELIEGLQGKTQELENQLRTLEILLANYEIQHVAGEIDEEIYQREISLLTTGLETTRNELSVIRQVTNQLSPITPSIQAPAAPEPVAQVIEAEIAQPTPVEPTLIEVTIESAPIESIAEQSSIPSTPIETAPIEIPTETVQAEACPEESTPIEAAPVIEALIETAPIIENAPVEAAPVIEAPIETAPIIETPTVEIAPIETAPIASPEPEVQVTNEPTPEIAPQEQVVIEPALQEPIISMEAAVPEVAPATEEAAAKTESMDVTQIETIAEPVSDEPAVEVPLQDFEVIPEVESIETTLEKVMEPEMEPVIQQVIVEEVQVPAHPLEAPLGAHSEVEQAQNAEEAATETEDCNKETE